MPQTTQAPRVETLTRPTVDTEYLVASEADLEKPYRVIIQNDDVTPMDFVVGVLCVVFELTAERAFYIMLEAHQRGQALVARLPYGEACERVYQAQHIARENGYPLSLYLEPDV